MLAISYFAGTHRTGLLVWTERDGNRQALGGFDPADAPPQEQRGERTTVVSTDAGEVVYSGWLHPDLALARFDAPEPEPSPAGQ